MVSGTHSHNNSRHDHNGCCNETEKPVFSKNYMRNTVFADTLHKRAINRNECTKTHCVGSFTQKKTFDMNEKTKDDKIKEATEFLKDYFESINKLNTEEHLNRVNEIVTSIETTNSHEFNVDELNFGCRTAWRNAPRCPGRIFWPKLDLIDARNVKSAKEMFDKICEFLKLAINNGAINYYSLVFPQRKGIGRDFRIWNLQLIGYAGYRIDENTVIGDRAQCEFTEICHSLGWKGKGTEFDVLPVVLQFEGQDPEWFEIPPECLIQIPFSHPVYDFASLNLRWFGVVTFSTFLFDIGGCLFTCVPFSGHYSGPEIGRAMSDADRYNKLSLIATKMGLDTNSNTSLWKDRALIELNFSILYSFQKVGCTITDHHTLSDQFTKFYHSEYKLRGGCPADWVWINTQLSSHLEDTFYMEMLNYKLRPSIEYQLDGWKLKNYLKKMYGQEDQINKRFKYLSIVGLFCSILMKNALKKRIKCTILYATETGKSEEFAGKLNQLYLRSFNSKIMCMSEYDINELKNESIMLLVGSTFGNGDAPGNGEKFRNELIKIKKTIPQDLSSYNNIKYSVFGLGNTSYPHYCAFGKQLNTLMGEIGCESIFEMGLGDELSNQLKSFKDWSFNCYKASLDKFSIKSDEDSSENKNADDDYEDETKWNPSSVRYVPYDRNSTETLNEHLSKWHNKKLLACILGENKNIQADNSDRRTLLSTCTSKTGDYVFEFHPGDHVGLIPQNRKEMVDEILKRLSNCPPFDQLITLEVAKKNSYVASEKYPPITIRTAFMDFLDITSPLKQDLLGILADQATDSSDKFILKKLSTDKADYQEWKNNKFPNLLEILEEFASIKPDALLLLTRLPKLQPRFYSISSWKEKNTSMDLTLGVVKYTPPKGNTLHYGVCSNWLDKSITGEPLPLFIREAVNFHMPSDLTVPIIMVGTGTGIAPFRSFWQKRQLDVLSKLVPDGINGQKWGEMDLYFGCRKPNQDDLFREELDDLLKNNILTSVNRAYSREDGKKKVYVQRRMEENGDKLFDLIYNKHGHFYICGDVKMADDVKNTITNIILNRGNLTLEEAKEYINKMKEESRFHEDIYGLHTASN